MDVDPSVLHHLQLGEDVLGVMAGASAGSGSRMAFAFGAMPAAGQQKAHVHQYGSLAPEERERRRLAGLHHAGMATAAAGGGAGGGGEGEQRLLSVRRMWASMPLGLALQVGETAKREGERGSGDGGADTKGGAREPGMGMETVVARDMDGA